MWLALDDRTEPANTSTLRDAGFAISVNSALTYRHIGETVKSS